MQFIFEKTTFVVIFVRKCNHEKIALKERNCKKIVLKNIAFDLNNTHNNKKMNKNINIFFAKKTAQKNCVKRICKTICYLHTEINI